MTTYDLQIYQGTTYNIAINLNNSDGTPVNLSGFAISGFLKYEYSDTGKLVDLSPQIINPVSGSISITVPASVTASIPITMGFYDVQIYSSGTVSKVLMGNAYIYPDVTF